VILKENDPSMVTFTLIIRVLFVTIPLAIATLYVTYSCVRLVFIYNSRTSNGTFIAFFAILLFLGSMSYLQFRSICEILRIRKKFDFIELDLASKILTVYLWETNETILFPKGQFKSIETDKIVVRMMGNRSDGESIPDEIRQFTIIQGKGSNLILSNRNWDFDHYDLQTFSKHLGVTDFLYTTRYMEEHEYIKFRHKELTENKLLFETSIKVFH
jgi:hypothetical protein